MGKNIHFSIENFASWFWNRISLQISKDLSIKVVESNINSRNIRKKPKSKKINRNLRKTNQKSHQKQIWWMIFFPSHNRFSHASSHPFNAKAQLLIYHFSMYVNWCIPIHSYLLSKYFILRIFRLPFSSWHYVCNSFLADLFVTWLFGIYGEKWQLFSVSCSVGFFAWIIV